jgi:uncharacterized protein YndB with AHSA1/START domain
MKIQRSISIDAPVENIWRLLVEPQHIMKWCSFARQVRYTSEQTEGIGTAFYFEERAAGILMKLHLVVNEWKFNKSVSFKMTSGNLVKAYEQRYTLKPESKGIHLTVFENVRLPYGIFGKLAGIIRRKRSKDHLENMLIQLKRASELKAAASA